MKTKVISVDKFLRKKALSKGVQVKEVNMSLLHFSKEIKQHILPNTELKTILDLVEKTCVETNVLYYNSLNQKYLRVLDSNMPGYVSTNFDVFNFYLLSEIMKLKEMSETEKSEIISRLCIIIEELAEVVSFAQAQTQ